MRALILVLSAVVLGLSGWILYDGGARAATGPTFTLGHLIGDAGEGERATYTDQEGNQLTFYVEKAVPSGPDRPPYVLVRRILSDRMGKPLPNADDRYEHMVTVHGIFPLTAPSDPSGYDRLWVWSRLRPETIDWQGRKRDTWRFDAIDPALPPDADTVVVWMDEAVPVFGIVRWTRGDRTWTWRGS
jgi:hypothetical protein